MTRDGSARAAVTVPLPAERAFAAFTQRMTEWWPREYTWGETSLEYIVMEPRSGGQWYERDSNGEEQAWGTVVDWDVPRRVVLSWAIGPDRLPETDPSCASEIEVRFVPDGESTRVEVEHRRFAAHGAEAADGYRAGMASPQGWPLILECFAAWLAE